MVVGNPARIARQRFPDAVVARLLAIRWWDWPIAKIMRHIPAIRGGDIAGLARAAADEPAVPPNGGPVPPTRAGM